MLKVVLFDLDTLVKGISPKPGVIDCLDALQANLSLGVTTNFDRKHTYTSLMDSDLLKYFPVILDREDASRGKPSSELCLKACREFKVEPYQALAVESNSDGILSARGAGVRSIFVSGTSYLNPDFEEVCWKCASMSDLVPLITKIRSTMSMEV